MAPFTACFVATGVLGASLLAAGLAGLWYRLRYKRNLTSVAMRMACHLGGFVSLWAVVTGALAVALLLLVRTGWLDHWYWGGRFRIDGVATAFLVFLLVHVAALLLYIHLLQQAMKAARYANR